MMPQLPVKEEARSSARKLLNFIGMVMKEATRSNGDLPPSSIAFDGGTKNVMLHKVLLGLVPPHELCDFPFWHRLQFTSIEAPLFPFKLGKLDGVHPIVGSSGPYHVSKRFSLHAISGIRKVCWGSISVCYAAMLKGGLAFKAFVCQDPQSDKQSSQRLNMQHACRDFDDWGVRIHAMIGGLFQSGWASASGFSQAQQQENLFTCYYIVLLQVMWQCEKGDGKWESKFLPSQTVKNVLGLCGHGILGNLMDAGFPDYRTELPIEQAFGEVKRPFRGSPNLKDCILGSHLHHLRQLRSLSKNPSPVPEPAALRQGLTKEHTVELAKHGFRSACIFQSLITITSKTPKEPARQKSFHSPFKFFGI